MMVLVAVAIGAGWLYSRRRHVLHRRRRGVLRGRHACSPTFVLLGHWFEMRARGGANDAIRALLDLAPPKAVVLRDGEPVEVPTAEVAGRRPAAGPARRRRSRSTASSRTASPRSTSPWSPARACRCTKTPGDAGHRRDDQHATARCGPGRPRSARTPRWRRSSRWSRRRRTPRRPGSGWPTGPRSGWCSSR